MRSLISRGSIISWLMGAALVVAPITLVPAAIAAETAIATSAATTSTATTSSATNSQAAPAKPVKKAVTTTVKKPAAKKTIAKTTTRKTVSKKTAVKKKVATTKPKRKPVAKARIAPKRVAAPRPLPIDFDSPDAYHNAARAYLVKVGDDVVWENESEKRLPQASLTKMMTALLVLESYRPNDVVEVSAAAAAETGSRLGLRAGDRILLSDLLAATLIRSANDACHALADWHSGSEAVFVARMNQRAEQLGLHNTQFRNACGFDHPEHYSTARDLVALASTAMDNPTFARIVNKERYTFRSVDGRRTFRIKSTNHLVGVLDGIQGVKTGFTNGAGPCLVAMAERNHERVWLVMLNARNRWWNATAMIDSAFLEGPRIVAQKRATEEQQAATLQPPAPIESVPPLASGV